MHLKKMQRAKCDLFVLLEHFEFCFHNQFKLALNVNVYNSVLISWLFCEDFVSVDFGTSPFCLGELCVQDWEDGKVWK